MINFKKFIKKTHSEIIQDSTDVQDKGLQDTKKAIEAEKIRIDKLISDLKQRLVNKQNPYISVIQFVLGPKAINDLAGKFVAIKPQTEQVHNKGLLIEGGQAAENLISTLVSTTGNKRLKYVRATPEPAVVKEVKNLITLLRANNLIDQREPTYYLGSSRLFAIKAGIKAPEPNEIETNEIIQKALQTKKDFGDIDLDVYLNKGVTTADIKFFLTDNLPKKYAAELTGEEINTAVVVDNTDDVIQIDIVNIKGKEKYFGVSQFSSMADMAVGIKGPVRDLLIRAIAASTPITPEKTNILDNMIKKSKEYKAFVEKYAKDGIVNYSIRYTLGGDGLAYRIEWTLNGKTKAYSKGGIKFDQLHRFIKNKQVIPTKYEDLKTIASMLGFENPEHIRHVTKMAQLISTFDKTRQQKIWESLTENIKTKLPNVATGRTIGQLSVKESEIALDYLKPFFNKIF